MPLRSETPESLGQARTPRSAPEFSPEPRDSAHVPLFKLRPLPGTSAPTTNLVRSRLNYTSQPARHLSSRRTSSTASSPRGLYGPRPLRVRPESLLLRLPSCPALPSALRRLLTHFRQVTQFRFARRAVDGLKPRARLSLGLGGPGARHGFLASLLHGTELGFSVHCGREPKRVGSLREGGVRERAEAVEGRGGRLLDCGVLESPAAFSWSPRALLCCISRASLPLRPER